MRRVYGIRSRHNSGVHMFKVYVFFTTEDAAGWLNKGELYPWKRELLFKTEVIKLLGIKRVRNATKIGFPENYTEENII